MARQLVFDTNALIGFERQQFDIAQFADDDIAITALSVAEFRVGIELAESKFVAARRQRFLKVVLEHVPVLDYTERTAQDHARLIAHVRNTGQPRGAHDLIIAAHALEHHRILVSLDAKARFADLPGVEAMHPA